MLGWKEIVQKYITTHSDQIRKATQPLRDHFGIGYFTYHQIDNNGKYTVLVDRPEWAEYYVNKQIYLHDPYLRHPSAYQPGITIIENHGSDKYKEILLDGGKKVLNMDTGAILIQKTADYVEFFGFCSNSTSKALQSLYLNHPKILKSFASHFKKELAAPLARMQAEAASLIDLKGKDFFCKQPIYPDVGTTTLLAYYQDLGIQCRTEQAAKLTQREKECLRLLIDAKSAKETAAILGLSARTVESYFENIKIKFSCWGKHELFAIAKILEETGLL